jgi:tetratricopeptide (TPR) repeat protein
MDSQSPQSSDDRFTALLGGWDEALAKGELPPATLGVIEPDLADRLSRGRRCVELLARLRPGRRALALQETPAGGDTARSGGASHLSALLPTTLGRFEIRRELGRGGFGIVYLAHDPLLKRDVALKVPRFCTLADPELQQRFSREAQAGAGLDHPNVAAVYDAGEVAGVGYIASAYCPGITLAQFLRKQDRPIAVAEAAALIACLADAVGHGHSRGILHRDLKPSNVMLVEAAPSGEPATGEPRHCCRLSDVWYCPKITDFGLARRIDDEAQTRDGAALGTPSYMAPEQARSGAQPSTPATDVYGLGAILYELLAGRAPFIGESPLEILDQVRQREVVPPGRLRPNLPRDVETICLKCLAKNPPARYGSAAQLAEDLRRFLGGRPILARPIGRAQRALRWCQRNPVIATLAGGIALALVVGTGVSMSLAVWALNEKSQAALHALQAKNSAQQERAARELADYGFAQAEKAVEDYLDGIESNQRLKEADFFDLRKQLLTSAIPFYEGFVKQKPGDATLEAKRGRAYARLAELRRPLGDQEQALADYRQAQAIFQKLAADFPSVPVYRHEQVQSHYGLGAVLIEQGNRKAAEPELRQALALLQPLVDEFPADPSYRSELAGIDRSLGLVLHGLGDHARASEAYLEAIELQQSLAAEFPAVAKYRQGLAQSYSKLGTTFKSQQNHSEAVAVYRKAILLQRSLASEFPSVAEYRDSLARSHFNLGSIFLKLRKVTEAQQEYTEALRLEQQLVDDFPSVPAYRGMLAAIRYGMAITFAAIGKHEEAKTEHRAVLQMRTRLVEDVPNAIDYWHGLANSLYSLAMLLAKDGELDEARRMYALAIDHQRKAYELVPTNGEYARSLRNNYHALGDLLLKLKDHAAAAETANRLAQVRPDSADDAQLAARFFGRCVTLASQDPQLSSEQRTALAQSYADQAMQHLHEAVRRGLTDPGRFKDYEALAPLRGRPEFEDLIRAQSPAALNGEP